MTKHETILAYLKEGRDWLKMLIPAFFAWHMKQPPWMNKKCTPEIKKDEVCSEDIEKK